MRITFVTRKFGNVERNSHCDVLHITPIRVARLFLDCNGDFAIKDYTAVAYCFDICRAPIMTPSSERVTLSMSADMSPYCSAHDEWLIMKLLQVVERA